MRRHGRVLGFYIPVRRKNDAEELRAALREARDSLAELRRTTGLSEEELVEDLASAGPEEREREDVSSRSSPRGALALMERWGQFIEDEEIDAMQEEIYAARERDTGRPVDLEA